MDTVKIGIIGVGGMGSHHAKMLKNGEISNAALAAVCDIDASKIEEYDDIPHYESSEKMIRSGDVDAVIIATPHYSHTTIGIDALKNGLHVLVEKPISVHKADCERLIAAHTDSSQVFAAMFNQRTDPHYNKVKKLIDDGELGEIRRVNWIITDWFRTATYYSSGGWRATWEGEGGGVLLNQCPHQLDLLQWLCGQPSKIRSFCSFGKYHDIEVEDDVTAYLEYPNGATGVFITTTGDAPGTNRLEITGERGKLVVQKSQITFERTVEPVQEFCDTTSSRFGKPDAWHIEIPAHGNGGQHKEIIQNFTDTIRGEATLIAPAEEGIKSVEIGNAMLLSSLQDKPVDLPIDAAVFEKELKKLIENSTFEKKTVEAKDTSLEGSF